MPAILAPGKERTPHRTCGPTRRLTGCTQLPRGTRLDWRLRRGSATWRHTNRSQHVRRRRFGASRFLRRLPHRGTDSDDDMASDSADGFDNRDARVAACLAAFQGRRTRKGPANPPPSKLARSPPLQQKPAADPPSRSSVHPQGETMPPSGSCVRTRLASSICGEPGVPVLLGTTPTSRGPTSTLAAAATFPTPVSSAGRLIRDSDLTVGPVADDAPRKRSRSPRHDLATESSQLAIANASGFDPVILPSLLGYAKAPPGAHAGCPPLATLVIGPAATTLPPRATLASDARASAAAPARRSRTPRRP